MRVEYYFSVNSPYVYIGSARVAQMAGQVGAGWRYKPLHFSALAARMGSLVMVDADPARKAYFAQDLARQGGVLARVAARVLELARTQVMMEDLALSLIHI